MHLDPLAYFDQQQRSYELVEKHRATLLAQAAALEAAEPGCNPTGVICEPDAPEARAEQLRHEQATGRRHTSEIVGTTRRTAAIELLKANAPAMIDWLAEPAPGVLPVVVITRDGFRLASLHSGADGSA